MFIRNICFIVLFSLILSNARGQKAEIPFKYIGPKNINGLEPNHLSKLEGKVLQILTRNGLGSFNDYATVIIVPSIEIYETEVVEGLKNIYVTNSEFSLYIGQIDGTVFTSFNKTIRGTGKSEKQSVANIISKIPTQSPSLKAFFNETEEKIIDYYNENCENIFAQAENLANTDQYDAALKTLWSIPPVAEYCFEQAGNRIREYYVRRENRNCKKYLNMAEAAVAIRDFTGAANALKQINPESDCYTSTESIKEAIKEQTGDTYEKWWEYQFEALDNAADIQRAKYEAVGTVGAAAAINAFGGTRSDGVEGGNSVVINNNSGSGSISQNQSANPGAVNGRRNDSALQALFKIVSPASRATTGEIVTVDDTITIYGFVEEPKKTEKLRVNGKETEWDDEGVFSRQIILKNETTSVPVILETRAGRKEETVVVIKKKQAQISKNEGSTPPKPPVDFKKVALIIGNNDYKAVGKLRNARNDAIDMANTLQSIGFSVTRLLDGDYETMRREVIKFNDRVKGSDIALFYYSGHGMEVNGENYLIPVDAMIQSESDVKLTSIKAQSILDAMDKLNSESLNVVILDACRTNPFPKSSRGGDGLARITPPSGTLVAYSTEPGTVASDGTGENGLYTGELIRQMKIPQRIEDVFINTRNEVERKSKGSQRPWEEARLKGVYYLKYEE